MDNEDEQISFMKRIREAATSMWQGKNSIDRLLRDKLDDYHLIEETPMPVRIGDRVMWVGCLTLDNLFTFIDGVAKIFGNIGMQITTFDVLANSDEMTKALMIHRGLRRELCKLIKKTILRQDDFYERQVGEGKVVKFFLKKVSYRYLVRHVTLPSLIQIFFLIYTYNFDSVKKNLSILAERMDAKALTENYIFSWLENLGGLSGAFAKPQFPMSDLSFSEDPNSLQPVE